MTMRDYVKTEYAPIPKGCYSQAISLNNTLFLAGQIGLDPITGVLAGEDFEQQLVQVMKNIAAVLQAAGSDLSKIVKLTVYLKNFDEHYSRLDNVMENTFHSPFPARTTIGVSSLPGHALVEVDAIAVIE